MQSRNLVEFYLYARHLHDETIGNALAQCGGLLAGSVSNAAASLRRRFAGLAPVVHLHAHAHGARC